MARHGSALAIDRQPIGIRGIPRGALFGARHHATIRSWHGSPFREHARDQPAAQHMSRQRRMRMSRMGRTSIVSRSGFKVGDPPNEQHAFLCDCPEVIRHATQARRLLRLETKVRDQSETLTPLVAADSAAGSTTVLAIATAERNPPCLHGGSTFARAFRLPERR